MRREGVRESPDGRNRASLERNVQQSRYTFYGSLSGHSHGFTNQYVGPGLLLAATYESKPSLPGRVAMPRLDSRRESGQSTGQVSLCLGLTPRSDWARVPEPLKLILVPSALQGRGEHENGVERLNSGVPEVNIPAVAPGEPNWFRRQGSAGLV